MGNDDNMAGAGFNAAVDHHQVAILIIFSQLLYKECHHRSKELPREVIQDLVCEDKDVLLSASFIFLACHRALHTDILTGSTYNDSCA